MAAFTDSHGEPLAYIDVVIKSGPPLRVPIMGQLFLGRECAGIDESRRLVIPDPEISRTHLEIRLDSGGDRAYVIDTSTNGTAINGARLERAVPIAIRPGDIIDIGDVTITFVSQRFLGSGRAPVKRTQARVNHTAMVMVVGDIINYSTISQITDESLVAHGLNTLWQRLAQVLHDHHGTLSHYAGDALFAVWELRTHPAATDLAIEFALTAAGTVDAMAPRLPLRGPDGRPIRMGWSVAEGMVAVAAMTRTADAVIGDSANVAFRLAGLAGRDGRATVIATGGVRRVAADRFLWGPGEEVELKGRSGRETVFPLLAQQPPVPSR